MSETPEKSPKSTSSGRSSRVRLNRSRPGPVSAALDEALEEAAARGVLVGECRVWAALARRTALVVDAAYRADDPDRVLKSTRELRELVDLLPLRAVESGGGVARDDGDDDDGRGEILSLVSSGPTLGDST